MPTPQEKTPQQKLDAMLEAFQTANKTLTIDPGRELRELIEKTPSVQVSFQSVQIDFTETLKFPKTGKKYFQKCDDTNQSRNHLLGCVL
jgi:hypothetical protein